MAAEGALMAVKVHYRQLEGYNDSWSALRYLKGTDGSSRALITVGGALRAVGGALRAVGGQFGRASGRDSG